MNLIYTELQLFIVQRQVK